MMNLNKLIFVIKDQLARFILRHSKFSYNGKKLAYFIDDYNTTWRNERAIEVTIALNLVKKYRPNQVLEIGNVLSHYDDVNHAVVDKYERAPRVINQDVISFKSAKNKKYQLIMSISTLEHVGWDEKPRDEQKIPQALKHLMSLLTDDGTLFFTFPIGYNQKLDQLFQDNQLNLTKQFCYLRLNKVNFWTQVEKEAIINKKYNHPFNNANAIVIAMIDKTIVAHQ